MKFMTLNWKKTQHPFVWTRNLFIHRRVSNLRSATPRLLPCSSSPTLAGVLSSVLPPAADGGGPASRQKGSCLVSLLLHANAIRVWTSLECLGPKLRHNHMQNTWSNRVHERKMAHHRCSMFRFFWLKFLKENLTISEH